MNKLKFIFLFLCSCLFSVSAQSALSIEECGKKMEEEIYNIIVNNEEIFVFLEDKEIFDPELVAELVEPKLASSFRKVCKEVNFSNYTTLKYEIILDGEKYTMPVDLEDLQYGVFSEDLAKMGVESIGSEYSILVVQKGALDNFLKTDTNPIKIISQKWMKDNKSKYLPKNEGGGWDPAGGACVTYKHDAADYDVINIATHNAFGEPNNRISGNDYYVFDGGDVYWGCVGFVAEVAITIVTWGAGAGVLGGIKTGGKAAAKVGKAIAKTSKAVAQVTKTAKAMKTAEKTAKKLDKAKDAIKSIKKIEKGTEKAASKYGKIGNVMKKLKKENSAAYTAVKEWRTAAKAYKNEQKKLKLLKQSQWTAAKNKTKGLVKKVFTKENLKFKNLLKTGSIWGGINYGAHIVGMSPTAGDVAMAIIEPIGTSYSSIEQNLGGKKVSTNAFGLLSKDDGNDVSHGTWLKWETGENEADTLANVLNFAEKLKNEIIKGNDSPQNGWGIKRSNDRKCSVDLFVVRPALWKGKYSYVIVNDDIENKFTASY